MKTNLFFGQLSAGIIICKWMAKGLDKMSE